MSLGWIKWVGVLVFFVGAIAHGDDLCSAQMEFSDPTAMVISFLSQQGPETDRLTPEILSEMVQHGRIPDGLSVDETFRMQVLIHLLKNPGVNRDLVVQWIQEQGEKENVEQRERKSVEVKTADLVGKMIFKPVLPGVEMMDTPVTQWMWKRVMGELPRDLRRPRWAKNPLFPINHFNADEMQKFIETLNLRVRASEWHLRDMIPDMTPRQIFRLPTIEEIYLILEMIRRENRDVLESGDLEDLSSFVWFRENSGMEHHEVGLKRPLLVNGLQFFDLFGQREELLPNGDQYSAWGGSVRGEGRHFFQNSPEYNSVNPSGQYVVDNPIVFYSFRLVRERVQ